MRSLTKIVFIVLLFLVFVARSQDSLTYKLTNKHHFFASLMGGATYLNSRNANTQFLPISALQLSYVPKRSKIMISIGPAFTPFGGLAFFGGAISGKYFPAKTMEKHNFIIEFGDRIAWSQEGYVYNSELVNNKYTMNCLYFGPGYLVFFGKEQKFFFSITGTTSINELFATYRSPAGSSHNRFNSFSNTGIAPALFIQAGLKVR